MPGHYLSAPALSWDAMLKLTKTELKLIPDPGIYIFFEVQEVEGTRVQEVEYLILLIDRTKPAINI